MKPKFRIRILLVSNKGRLIYKSRLSDTTDFNEEIGGTSYRIRKEGLYKKDAWLYAEILNKLTNFSEYWILFNEGDPNSILPSNPQVTPYELYMINNATVLGSGLKSLLSRDFLAGKGAFLILVLALIAGYLLLNSGAVKF